jgi:hypothetical protein
MHGQIVLRLFMILFNSNPTAHRERTKQKRDKKRKKCSSYNHYSSPTLSGGLQAADGGTLDDRDSGAWWVCVQRFSILSFISSVLYLDPGNSKSDFSLGKCDKIAVSAKWAPHSTPSRSVALTQPLAGSVDGDNATAWGGILLGFPSAGPQTRVVELRSSSCSSHFTQSCMAASSRRAAR